MQSAKRDENRRGYRLRADRCEIKIKEIDNDYLSTAGVGPAWEKINNALCRRAKETPAELFSALADRRNPGVIGEKLKKGIYILLREFASDEFVNKALNIKRGRS